MKIQNLVRYFLTATSFISSTCLGMNYYILTDPNPHGTVYETNPTPGNSDRNIYTPQPNYNDYQNLEPQYIPNSRINSFTINKPPFSQSIKPIS